MRKSIKADKAYHHAYYMKHRAKYLYRQLHWAHTHPQERRRRSRMSYYHKHNYLSLTKNKKKTKKTAN